jgi:hypothetical protein
VIPRAKGDADSRSDSNTHTSGRPGALTAETHAFRGVLGAKVIICRPADPEAKGLLERVHGYLETSFRPGRICTGPADFNIQLGQFFAAANRMALIAGPEG